MKELIKNTTTKGYRALQGKVYSNLFKSYFDFVSADKHSLDYVETCAKYLNSLDDALIDDLCRACIRYCNSFREGDGKPKEEFASVRDVLKLVSPLLLIVPHPKDPNVPVIHMELNCEWEEEHGMEWVIRENKVMYVGSYNGENPWGDYSHKHRWNYAK